MFVLQKIKRLDNTLDSRTEPSKFSFQMEQANSSAK